MSFASLQITGCIDVAPTQCPVATLLGRMKAIKIIVIALMGADRLAPIKLMWIAIIYC